MGGNISDMMMRRCGMQGRLLAQTFGLIFEGISIIVFSKCTTIGSAMPVMVVFSALVQAVEGMTFGIVPYVDPANLGAVCGVVGAWGNIGAVIFSWLFREFFSEQLEGGFNVLGFLVLASSLATMLVKIPGHSSLFDSEPYTPATVLATEALARVAKLEEKLQMTGSPARRCCRCAAPPRRSTRTATSGTRRASPSSARATRTAATSRRIGNSVHADALSTPSTGAQPASAGTKGVPGPVRSGSSADRFDRARPCSRASAALEGVAARSGVVESCRGTTVVKSGEWRCVYFHPSRSPPRKQRRTSTTDDIDHTPD